MQRILIADDHIFIRKGLIQVLLTEFPSADIVETNNAEDLLAKAFAEKWDLIITDISMPGRSGLDTLAEIHQHSPSLPVVVLSMFTEEQYAIRALKAGASGYLNKMSAPEELIKAINWVLLGKKYITPVIAEQMANYLEQNTEKDMHEHLSNREFEIFKMLAAGKSISAIAAQICLSPSTISTYRARIMTKMHLHTNADLTLYSVEHKLV
ncbi:MAG: response regulator transcription factor [Bacteroidota bacterium]